MMNLNMEIYNDIVKVHLNWDKINKESFYAYRLEQVKLNKKSSNDFQECSSSGSSNCRPKKYKWGPNFSLHYNLYNKIFFNNQNFIHLHCFSNQKSYYELKQWRFYIGIDKIPPKNYSDKWKNIHVCCNPEVLYFNMLRYGNFVSNFFDINSCVFSFTASILKEEHKNFFLNNGLQVKDHMRCWDGGATYFTCSNFNKHWIDFASVVNNIENRLISTDIWNQEELFINYWNGDNLITSRKSICECGLPIDEIQWIENPRYFIVKNQQYSYDSVCAIAQLHGKFDFLSIEFSDNYILCNISVLGDFEKHKFESTLSSYLDTNVAVNLIGLPRCKRKYIRIKKFYKNMI